MAPEYPNVPTEALLLVEQIAGMPAMGASPDGVENNVILATTARRNHTDETGTMLLVLRAEMVLETIAGLLSAGHHAFGTDWARDALNVVGSYPLEDVAEKMHEGWTP
jgi:hypothetical protein